MDVYSGSKMPWPLHVREQENKIKSRTRFIDRCGPLKAAIRELQHSFCQQVFSNLHGVGGSPFPEVITHDPAVKGIGLRFIPADAAHKGFVFLVCG